MDFLGDRVAITRVRKSANSKAGKVCHKKSLDNNREYLCTPICKENTCFVEKDAFLNYRFIIGIRTIAEWRKLPEDKRLVTLSVFKETYNFLWLEILGDHKATDFALQKLFFGKFPV